MPIDVRIHSHVSKKVGGSGMITLAAAGTAELITKLREIPSSTSVDIIHINV